MVGTIRSWQLENLSLICTLLLPSFFNTVWQSPKFLHFESPILYVIYDTHQALLLSVLFLGLKC
ncbi:hypothetical protein DFH07DRAFT_838912 [Mycena maculata]|uniref:Uncharacterized protein n=1 Tax=Mycena maculata TaxID=230809 RepID=A0AAD7IDN3_9AGAR|nr:hypothetical protein DFH07DRAFT_838912 [Mycena maculata]